MKTIAFKSVLLLLCLSFALSSCRKKSKETEVNYETESIYIDLGKEYKEKKFPETNYSMTVQKLEDNKDYPVGYIDKLIVDKNRIYILDRDKAKAIFIYNRNGRLLHVMDYTGRGQV